MITGESKPNKMAPLYSLGSNFFLNFFKLFIEIKDPNFPNIELYIGELLMKRYKSNNKDIGLITIEDMKEIFKKYQYQALQKKKNL